MSTEQTAHHGKGLIQVTVSREISEQQTEDMLVTAMEGGSNYWYWLDSKPLDGRPKSDDPTVTQVWEAVKEGNSFDVREDDEDGDVLGQLNMDNLRRGWHLFAEQYPARFAECVDEDSSNWDGSDADLWFQLVVMGKVVYG